MANSPEARERSIAEMAAEIMAASDGALKPAVARKRAVKAFVAEVAARPRNEIRAYGPRAPRPEPASAHDAELVAAHLAEHAPKVCRAHVAPGVKVHRRRKLASDRAAPAKPAARVASARRAPAPKAAPAAPAGVFNVSVRYVLLSGKPGECARAIAAANAEAAQAQLLAWVQSARGRHIASYEAAA